MSVELHLYEELLLLALNDDKGSLEGHFTEYMLAAAILSELCMENVLTVSDDKKPVVTLNQAQKSPDDPLFQSALARIKDQNKPRTLQHWVSKIAGMKNLRHDAAQKLIRRGVLRLEESKILLLFTRKLYPEVDPRPERALIDRIRNAVVRSGQQVSPRTMVIIALAEGAKVLKNALGKDDYKSHQDRIRDIGKGNVTTTAAKEVIQGLQAAIMVAAIMPAIMSTTTTTSC